VFFENTTHLSESKLPTCYQPACSRLHERITSERIPGAGSTTTKQTYSFTDRNVVNGLTYWDKLEDIDYSGKRTLHGPISVTP